ncbi:hypothetical protein D3C75_560340 [compost metagenome]
MTLLIRFTDLGQQVEGHLPIKEFRLQRPHIQQFGGLPGELTHGFAALGRYRQAGGQADALQIKQIHQWRQHHRQRGGRRAWTADLKGFVQAGQHLGIGFRHNLWRLFGRQGTGEIDNRATGIGRAGSETQRNRRAGGKECQLHLAEVELIDFPHPHVLAAKRHRTAGRLAAGQQVQVADREIALFENLHECFADSTGGADHGNINGLAHGFYLWRNGGSGTLPGGGHAGNSAGNLLRLYRPLRGQARSHRFQLCIQTLCSTPNTVGAGLPAKRPVWAINNFQTVRNKKTRASFKARVLSLHQPINARAGSAACDAAVRPRPTATGRRR